MRFFFLAVFLLSTLSSMGQIKTWFDLFTTNRLQHITATKSRVFASAKNALLIYTPSTGLVERLSAQNQLSDTSISALYATSNRAFIGYSTGNIDVIKNNEIINLPSIKNNLSLLPEEKKIYTFTQDGNLLWLATGYGLTSINLDNLSFDRTIYFLDSLGQRIPVIDIKVLNNRLYTLTPKGLYFTGTQNIGPLPSWNHLQLSNGKELGIISGQIYVLTYQNQACAVFRLQDSSFYQITYQPGMYKMKIINNKIYLLGPSIFVLDSNGNQLAKYDHYQSGQKIYANDAVQLGNSLYIADRYASLVKDLSQSIRTASLFSDQINAIKSAGEYVYVLHKTDTIDRQYDYRAVLSIIDEIGDIQYFTTDKVNQFLAMAVDPHDPDHWFLASDSVGLVEVKNRQIVNVYTTDNSPLTVANDYVKISYLKFDNQGRLWILYNSSTYPVLLLNPDGSWQAIESSAVGVGKPFSRFILTSQGFFYAPVKKFGLMAINPNTGDARVFYPSRRIGSRINDIAQDKDGVLWFSTSDGLGYLTTQDFTSPDFKAIRPLVQVTLNDTTIYAYLLDNANCSRIAVDDGNRKWVGTTYFGAVLLAPDGLSEINHFNVNNGSIVTDAIYDIEYNPLTGIVYFITDQGIIAYRNDSSRSMDDFGSVKIFPNPIRPYYSGPITITGLKQNTLIKITDLQGNLVFEMRSNGGTAVWDGKVLNGSSLHSGVYLVVCSDEQGKDKCVHKLLIIK